MPGNSDKPHLWKADVLRSIDYYNDRFLRFAPGVYREQRRIRLQANLDARPAQNLSRETGINIEIADFTRHVWPIRPRNSSTSSPPTPLM